MTTTDVGHTILGGAREAFFKAMLDGYAGDQKKSAKTVSSDGYKTIEFPIGDYLVVDRYCTTSCSDFSAGTTTIFFRGSAVWWMSYAGRYPEKVIPFLKEVLRKAYEEEIFFGGRGRDSSNNEAFVYSNQETEGWDFTRFKGREEISDIKTTKRLGFHEYLGMALI
jgi:hypothetical protein